MAGRHVCTVPTAQVIDLAAELAALGGGDVAVGRAWAGAVVEDGSAAERADLDVCCCSAAGLVEALQQELWPWLHGGYNATALLLGPGPPQLTAAAIVRSAASAAVDHGMNLGLSWLVVGSSSCCGTLGKTSVSDSQRSHHHQQQQAASSLRRSASRLGRGEAPQPDGELDSCTICATSLVELDELLAAAAQQLEAASNQKPADHPALLLQLTLVAGDGRQTAALHVLQLGGQEAGDGMPQQQQLVKMIEEVADLHYRRREGEHLVTSARLSQLNQLLVPLVAGTARLFLAAELVRSATGSQLQQKLLNVLCAARGIRTVCAKGAGAATAVSGSGGPPQAAWLPCSQFLQQVEQQRQADRRRQAEAAALAAAEAERREKLRLMAQQRQNKISGQQGAHAAPCAQAEHEAGAVQEARSPTKQKQQPRLQSVQQSAEGLRCNSQPAAKRPAACDPAISGQGHAEMIGGQTAEAKAEAHPAAEPAATESPGSPDVSSSSLQRLRAQFQSLYQQTVGASRDTPPSQPASAAARAPQLQQANSGSLARAGPRQEPSTAQIAAGVAAADGIATHVAAQRLCAAAEALRAKQAQQELLKERGSAGVQFVGSAEGESPAPAAGGASPSFSWSGRNDTAGSMGQRLEEELAVLRSQAALMSSSRAKNQASGALEADSELASLAELEAEAPSLGAVFHTPAGRFAGSSVCWQQASSDAFQQHLAQDDDDNDDDDDEQQQQWVADLPLPAEPFPEAAGVANPIQPWADAAAGFSEGAPGSELVSDVFKSDMQPWSPQPPALAECAATPANPAAAAVSGPATRYTSWQPGDDSTASSSNPTSAALPAAGASQKATFARGSYAAYQLQQQEAKSPAAGSSAQGMHSKQQPLSAHQSSHASLLMGSPAFAVVASAADVAAAADTAALLSELEREQRLNSALLQQLHELQQQLEECAAAAAAAAEPLAPGVDNPADFNALLAALQLQRQESSRLRRQLLLQQQQAEEQQLALEAQLHTQRRQLLVANARCRAWEERSPLAALFQRYEGEFQHLLGQCRRLEQENSQLARLLTDADLERLSGWAQQLLPDAAAVCREQQRRLQQLQAQVSKLQEERSQLQKKLQGAERRDRLAELARKQAESGMKTSADLRQQLAASERQREAQSLAAAQAAAEATRLQERLQNSEAQLGRALAEKADLHDTIESLRKQISLLRGQAGRDRVLRSLQLPLPP